MTNNYYNQTSYNTTSTISVSSIDKPTMDLLRVVLNDQDCMSKCRVDGDILIITTTIKHSQPLFSARIKE